MMGDTGGDVGEVIGGKYALDLEILFSAQVRSAQTQTLL